MEETFCMIKLIPFHSSSRWKFQEKKYAQIDEYNTNLKKVLNMTLKAFSLENSFHQKHVFQDIWREN